LRGLLAYLVLVVAHLGHRHHLAAGELGEQAGRSRAGSVVILPPPVGPEGSTEHFVYVMSPSRVESMIDISSDEEATMNGVPSAGQV